MYYLWEGRGILGNDVTMRWGRSHYRLEMEVGIQVGALGNSPRFYHPTERIY